MDAPKNLSHTPIISVGDYDKIDGKYANATDAMALSIGLAQYDRSDISLKVWRYTNDEKWSRQSEELPVSSKFRFDNPFSDLLVDFGF